MQGACSTRTSLPRIARQALQQVLGAGHFAGEAVAHAHGERLRRRLAFLDDVEVVIDRRDPRKPRSAAAASLRPGPRDGPPRAGRSGPVSRCRCSISRSRWREAVPSPSRTSASAWASARRPFGPRRLRSLRSCGALGAIRMTLWFLHTAPLLEETGGTRPLVLRAQDLHRDLGGEQRCSLGCTLVVQVLRGFLDLDVAVVRQCYNLLPQAPRPSSSLRLFCSGCSWRTAIGGVTSVCE